MLARHGSTVGPTVLAQSSATSRRLGSRQEEGLIPGMIFTTMNLALKLEFGGQQSDIPANQVVWSCGTRVSYGFSSLGDAKEMKSKTRHLLFYVLVCAAGVWLPFKCMTLTPHYLIVFDSGVEYVILNGRPESITNSTLSIYMRPWPMQQLRYKFYGHAEQCLTLHTSWNDDNSSGLRISRVGAKSLSASPALPRTSTCE